MNVIDICKKLDAPQEMLPFISEKLVPLDVLQSLTDIDAAPNGYERFKELLSNDGNGLKMFACMLNAAAITYEKYRLLGISEEIFFDTFCCFKRFAEEYRASYGIYGFDRGWWTYRQLSCVLFKIGELEYEFRDHEKTVHLHVPSGADISVENCRKSLSGFNEFKAKHFPKKRYPIVCNSWLLSPSLDELLPKDSNIVKFKNCFDIISRNEAATEFLQWVYGRDDFDYDKLPEKTTLQRNMKKFLLNGGRVGGALGRLVGF